MNDNAKVFSLIEMREMMIDTSDYQMMEEVGEFTGTLEMKAQGHKKSIRIFLTLDDGRKIITPIFWWHGRHTSDFTICRSARSSDFFIRKVIKTKFTLRRSKLLKRRKVYETRIDKTTV